MVHRSALAITAALALTACGQSNEAPAPAPAPEAPPAAQLTWDALTSDAGSTLALREDTGIVVLTIACLRQPARMRVTAPNFSEISSEERLSFGADSEPFVFVAQLGDEEPGVAAEREITLDLVERLQNAQTVAMNYGAQNGGPFPAPGQAAQSFANVCREIAG